MTSKLINIDQKSQKSKFDFMRAERGREIYLFTVESSFFLIGDISLLSAFVDWKIKRLVCIY